MTYADQIGTWQGFYTTVAGLSAGLVGLLFVGLGLNPQIISAGGPAGMRVLAAQTFHNFLVLLVIALMALVPDTTGRSLAITLLIVGTQGVIRVALDLRRARRDPDPTWRALQALTRYAAPALAYAICLWLVIDLWDGVTEALGDIVAIVLLLLLSATANCWDLLEAIGNRRESAAREDERPSSPHGT
jgi:hypothetical protein